MLVGNFGNNQRRSEARKALLVLYQRRRRRPVSSPTITRILLHHASMECSARTPLPLPRVASQGTYKEDSRPSRKNQLNCKFRSSTGSQRRCGRWPACSPSRWRSYARALASPSASLLPQGWSRTTAARASAPTAMFGSLVRS